MPVTAATEHLRWGQKDELIQLLRETKPTMLLDCRATTIPILHSLALQVCFLESWKRKQFACDTSRLTPIDRQLEATLHASTPVCVANDHQPIRSNGGLYNILVLLRPLLFSKNFNKLVNFMIDIFAVDINSRLTPTNVAPHWGCENEMSLFILNWTCSFNIV